MTEIVGVGACVMEHPYNNCGVPCGRHESTGA